METKKSKRTDLEWRKPIFLEIGLVIALFVVLMSFEFIGSREKVQTFVIESSSIIDDVLIIQTTHQKELPPPPQATTMFDITDNKSMIDDILEKTNDFYRWRVEYGMEELSALVKERSGIDFGEIVDLQPVERAASGRIVRLRVVGSKRVVVVGKELEIRRWLSKSHLYSSAFVVDRVGTGKSLRFVLKGAGWGHGVGLCQIGAAMMGEKGFSHKDILLHYYPGATIEDVFSR